MEFFIENAWAQEGGAAQGSPVASLIFFAVIFVLFYFLLLRPQVKRAKEHRKMVESLAKNDEVVTNGGLLGKITDLGESFVTLEVAEGVQVKVQKNSVAQQLPKGTIKGK